jgi:hypothetical protein
MSSTGGLSRRRVQANVASDVPSSSQLDPSSSTVTPSSSSSSDLNGFGHGHAGTAMEGGNKVAYDPRDLRNDDHSEGGKMPRLTILEEVLLLGLKDKQVSVLFLPSCCCISACRCHHFYSHFYRMAPGIVHTVVLALITATLPLHPGIPFLLE